MSVKLILKNGLEQDRQAVIPSVGEVITTLDTRRMYIGDGITAGGKRLGSSNFVVTTPDELVTLDAIVGDIAICINGNVIYYLAGDDSSLPDNWHTLDVLNQFQTRTEDFTAKINSNYLIRTTDSAVNIAMPSTNLIDGVTVAFMDYTGEHYNYPSILRTLDDATIMKDNEDFHLDVPNAVVHFTYIESEKDWTIYQGTGITAGFDGTVSIVDGGIF